MEEDLSSCIAGMGTMFAAVCSGGGPGVDAGTWHPSSYTAGMDTVFATVCPGGSSDLGTGIWSRDYHRALQVWIRCLLLCVLEEATARVR